MCYDAKSKINLCMMMMFDYVTNPELWSKGYNKCSLKHRLFPGANISIIFGNITSVLLIGPKKKNI